jgi:hypothetical protein
MHQQMSQELTQCIQDCLDCYRVCQQSATMHCLELGGKHVEPKHFRLMLDCAETCRSAAAMMLNASTYAHEHCRMCAQLCRDCAESCRNLGDMDDCVAACERCAESCERMAASGGGQAKGRAETGERPAAH